MKSLLFAMLAFESLALASPGSGGNFTGTGTGMVGEGSYSYEVRTEITEVSQGKMMISSQYEWDEAGSRQSARWEFIARASAGAGFDVLNLDGVVIGQGSCLAETCHYEVKTGELSLAETLTFTGDVLLKQGSKSTGSTVVAWSERLKRGK